MVNSFYIIIIIYFTKMKKEQNELSVIKIIYLNRKKYMLEIL